MQRTPQILVPGEEPEVLQFGPLTIEPEGYAVFVGDRNVPVTLSEFAILRALAAHPFRVLDRAALMDSVRDAATGERVAATDLRLIDRHIARLRRKLNEAGCDCIQTMRFTGYRFSPPASRDQSAPERRPVTASV